MAGEVEQAMTSEQELCVQAIERSLGDESNQGEMMVSVHRTDLRRILASLASAPVSPAPSGWQEKHRWPPYTHGRVVCACGRVVAQCRCPEGCKVVGTVDTCDQCAGERRSVPAAPTAVSPAPDGTTRQRVIQVSNRAFFDGARHNELLLVAAREFGLITKELAQASIVKVEAHGDRLTIAGAGYIAALQAHVKELDQLLADLSAPSEQET